MMSNPSAFSLDGVVPIVPTPFRTDESIDLGGLAACVRFAVGCGVGAVCLPAYASEFYKLTETERLQVIETALAAAEKRVRVIAQSNHPSAKVAAELARRHEKLGADLVSFAVPRQFSVPAGDLLDYCRRICDAVALPVLIQDFNPGGPTIGADFAQQLHQSCPNFRFLKLEEPLMAGKVRAIRAATAGEVGVLAGWGGMFVLELLPAGICGLMPGLGMADLLQKMWRQAQAGLLEEALDLFAQVLPQIVFALQNLELFLCLEKKLLATRGVIDEDSAHVRRPTWTPDADTLAHGLRLNGRVKKVCECSAVSGQP